MPQLSRKRMKYLIKDERKASREYRKAGYPGMARDEARHRSILIRQLRRKRR